MRFYRHSRTVRLWATTLWSVLLLTWLGTFWHMPPHDAWHGSIWTLLALTSVDALWTSWEITSDELIARTFPFRKRYRLSAIVFVGDPQQRRWWLGKTLQVDMRGQVTVFVNVADRNAFQETLRSAVAASPHDPLIAGPLGLAL